MTQGQRSSSCLVSRGKSFFLLGDKELTPSLLHPEHPVGGGVLPSASSWPFLLPCEGWGRVPREP